VPRLQAGATIPDLTDADAYPDAAGNRRQIGSALARGPVVLGIYKSSCQASKVLFPFLERLHQRHAESWLTVLGVSQDSANITRSFARRYGITFPLLVEGPEHPLTRAFGVDFTPSVYLVRPDRTVAFAFEGFLRDQVNEFGEAVATELEIPAAPLIAESETDVPFFVPG
jgi:peroxiredoxin